MFYLQQSYSELRSARVLLLGCPMGWFQTYFFLKGDGRSVRGLKADTAVSTSKDHLICNLFKGKFSE